MSNQPTYLVHHGVKGQKWGVRRYRNADGSLTEAGKKKYYLTDESGIQRLSKHGLKFNNRNQDKLNRYKNSALYNINKTNPNFKAKLEQYETLRNKNRENYLEEREKWISQTDYKGKSYYKFKDMSYNKWVATDAGKKEAQLKKEIENTVRESVKQHPLYNKTYTQLRYLNSSTINDDYAYEVKYGEEVIRRIMNDINYR